MTRENITAKCGVNLIPGAWSLWSTLVSSVCATRVRFTLEALGVASLWFGMRTQNRPAPDSVSVGSKFGGQDRESGTILLKKELNICLRGVLVRQEWWINVWVVSDHHLRPAHCPSLPHPLPRLELACPALSPQQGPVHNHCHCSCRSCAVPMRPH